MVEAKRDRSKSDTTKAALEKYKHRYDVSVFEQKIKEYSKHYSYEDAVRMALDDIS